MQPEPEQITDQQGAKKQHGLIGQAEPERARGGDQRQQDFKRKEQADNQREINDAAIDVPEAGVEFSAHILIAGLAGGREIADGLHHQQRDDQHQKRRIGR